MGGSGTGVEGGQGGIGKGEEDLSTEELFGVLAEYAYVGMEERVSYRWMEPIGEDRRRSLRS